MSTPTRAELAGKIIQLKTISEQIIMEIKMLDERVSGLYAFIQQLPNYDEMVEQLKEKAKQNNNEKKLEI
tara:strand:+ start:684 stop:893 length:210 start_codon:yes stop_codon:yes gene_type:complete